MGVREYLELEKAYELTRIGSGSVHQRCDAMGNLEDINISLAELTEMEDELAYYQRNDKSFTSVKCKCGHSHNVKHGCPYCLREENKTLTRDIKRLTHFLVGGF